MVRKMTRTVILSRRTTRCVDGEKNDTTVILSRVDGEGSPNAKTSHFAILRRAAPTQDDGRVIRSREDGEGSQAAHSEILRSAQDDDRAEVEALTQKIDDALDAVTLQADSH